MRVQATAMGYYGLKRRRPGDVFDLKPLKKQIRGKDDKPVLDEKGNFTYKVITVEQQFSVQWMKKVESSMPVTPDRKGPKDIPGQGPTSFDDLVEEVEAAEAEDRAVI